MTSVNASSTNLWATASKEWLIQPKPKPGRKPTKDPTCSPDNAEVDPKGRRVQNRAAQRAFRERKQSQLSELQARIQAYEQGEIERNVALQNIAKRLKEENERLRQENDSLQEKLAQFEQQKELQDYTQVADKKRWRNNSPASALSMQAPATKKTRTDPVSKLAPSLSPSHLPSPTSFASSPNTTDTTDSQFSELSYNPQPTLGDFSELSSNPKVGEDPLRSFSYGCGFCDQSTICVCHEIAVQGIGDRFEVPDTAPSGLNIIQKPENLSISILDNLPSYQPPVPLRRRPGGAPVNSVFPVARISPSTSSTVPDTSCSGDPSNCLACGGDDFGKAFCEAIRNASSRGEICEGCPSTMGPTTGGCCGGTSSGRKCSSSSFSSPLDLPAASAPSDFMLTNDAWQKIKAHPNVEFADLSLLAEVVASKSLCSGPLLSVSKTTEMHHDLNATINIFSPRQIFGNQREHAANDSPPPRLVPEEVLLECGRRTLRRVHTDGVQEALRLLDAKFTS